MEFDLVPFERLGARLRAYGEHMIKIADKVDEVGALFIQMKGMLSDIGGTAQPDIIAKQLESVIQTAGIPEPKDLKEKTIVQAAAVVLRDGENQWLTPAEIVTRMLARGYQSGSWKNTENDPEKIAKSARIMMDRDPSTFCKMDGKYRLVSR